MPRMKHPDTPRRIDVAETSVDIYVSQGWQVVEPVKRTAPEKSSPPKAPPSK